MLAVLLALKSFASHNNISIKLNIDNRTVVFIFKNMGTYHNAKLNPVESYMVIVQRAKHRLDIPYYSLQIPGYDLIRSDHPSNNKRGGVAKRRFNDWLIRLKNADPISSLSG